MKKNSPKASAPKPPTAANPGGELPDAVTAQPGARTAQEREEDRDANAVFRTLAAELGEGASVSLFRSHPAHGQMRPGYIGSLPIDQFTLENVTNLYGGGDFIAEGKTSAGNFAGQKRKFQIDHTIAPKNPRGEKEKPAAAPAGPSITEVMAAARAEQGPLVDLVKTVLARPQSAPDHTLILEVLKQSQASESRVMSVIQKMHDQTQTMMRELADSRGSGGAEEELEKFARMADMMGYSREGGREAAPVPAWVSLLESFAKPLAEVFAKQFAGGVAASPIAALPMAAATTQPNGTPPASPGGAAVDVTASPVTENQLPDAMNPILKYALANFKTSALKAAARLKNPFEFVDGVLSMAPDQYLPQIFNVARADDWFTQIFGNEAEALKHVQWLAEMREVMIAKALVHTAEQFSATQKTPEETARQFFGWCPINCAETILGAAEDAANWAELFEGAPVDPAWLETFRGEIVKTFSEGEKVETFPAQAAAAAPAASPKPASAAAKKQR